MPFFLYTYTKTDVNVARLKLEIQQSPTISIAVDRVNIESSTLVIYMKAELSEQEESALDSLVNDHINTPLPSQDPKIATEDNITLVRKQTSPLNWSFQLYGIMFTTATENAVCRHTVEGITSDHLTAKFYTEDGIQVSGSDIATKASTTLIEWMPPWNYYIWGGMFHHKVSPSGGIVINVRAVPDYPKSSGGSIDFISSTDLSFVGPDAGLDVGAETTQLLEYNGGIGTNKLGFYFHHASGLQHEMFIGLKLYKEKNT